MSIDTRRKKGLDPIFFSLFHSSFFYFLFTLLQTSNSTFSLFPLLLLPPLDPTPTLHSSSFTTSPALFIFYNPLANVHTNVHARIHTDKHTTPSFHNLLFALFFLSRALIVFFYAPRSILFFFCFIFFFSSLLSLLRNTTFLRTAKILQHAVTFPWTSLG